jgi:hypothetical protein
VRLNERDGPRYPQPLKQPRYPLRSKEKRMTIAAGFVCQSGVLLGTDSLLSAEQMAYCDKKMVPICGRDYTAIIAFAGDPKFCVSTV